jgi:hypothetical protein
MIQCAAKRIWSTEGSRPARELVRYHPVAIGAATLYTEVVGAFGVEGRIGDLANLQAVRT